jgi:serine/threonine-protein phosphatase 5
VNPSKSSAPVLLIMATDKNKALAAKNDGNKAFLKHDWPTAIDHYSQAIELDGSEPTYYANRAQVRLLLCVLA